MNIGLLHDFLCVSDTMNFSLSAEARHTTQSNLSKRIRQLELWLGCDLIDRRGRPLVLTKAGQDFIPIARNIISQLDEYKGAHVPWSVAEGAVSIAMPHSATVSVFPGFKQRIAAQIPKASFALRLANHDVVATMLARSECELALVTYHPATPQAEEFAVFRPVEIARERLVIVAPPDAGRTRPLPLHVSHRRTYIGQIWQNCRVALPVTEEVEHGMAADIRAYCLSGNGRGVVPETLVEADIASGKLSLCVPEMDLSYSFSLYCAPKASALAKKIWKVAEALSTREPYSDGSEKKAFPS